MRYINKTYKYIVLFLFVLTVGTSCDDGFTEMNIHPMQPTETSINFLFTGLEQRIQLPGDYGLYTQNERLYQWAQLGSYQSGGDPSEGGNNPNNMHDKGRNAVWNSYYAFLANYEVIKEKEMADVDPARLVIKMEITKILHAYYSLRTTDLYGDMPYFEAGKGSSELLYRPVFDSQQEIYMDAIENLKSSASVLSGVSVGDVTEAGSVIEGYGNADVIYQGNVDKWVKLANTVRLRYALRMSNVDASFATPHIKDAMSGPLMESYDDALKFEGLNKLWTFQYGPFSRVSTVAWKYMNADDEPAVDGSDIIDPRVHIWYETNEDGEWVAAPVSWDFDARPDGITGDPYNPDRRGDNDDPTGKWKGNYSAHNWYVADNVSSNMEWQVTYSESCFLRAEAILRGDGSGDAKDWYEKGIEASVMRTYKLNTHEDWGDAAPTITPEEIAAFIAHPRIAYNSSTGAMQIAVQRWLDHTYNPAQAWCLVRRTGLIPLDVVKDRQSNAVVPMATRLMYPETEATENTENYNAQLDKMGGENSHTAPIWWDINR